MTSTFVEKLLSSGELVRHIRDKIIPTYARRYYAMVEAIQTHLEPLGVRITCGQPYVPGGSESKGVAIAGGFFLLITLPPGLPAASVLAKSALEKHALKFAHGKMFQVKGDVESQKRAEQVYGNTVRLCWSFHEEGEIMEGILRFKKLLLSEVER